MRAVPTGWKIVVPIAEWTARNQKLTEILFAGVTAIAATIAILAGVSKAYKAVSGAVNDVKGAVKGAQAAMQKLGLISKKTGDDHASRVFTQALCPRNLSGAGNY